MKNWRPSIIVDYVKQRQLQGIASTVSQLTAQDSVSMKMRWAEFTDLIIIKKF